ncbi:hypothetical protein SAMN02982989_3997 [Xaviernesmea oryzae]|uniref:BrnT family toxin n=1 Tax=Xaviernesmea oryzae TaxID=464029 RepID=A0A1X7GLU1_9HYPH|nr:BrnT family toxin [Xaviernesmea oryzae]SMF71247.1 hypothetical protein SAMN02982989_3997 [Xaviernesmea oryzae]
MPRFEWDAQKARTNKDKHKVSFELAQHIWDDPLHVIIPDTVYEGEERWLAVGSIGPVTVLVAAHVYRGDDVGEVIRIISARRATPHERKRYEEEAS